MSATVSPLRRLCFFLTLPFFVIGLVWVFVLCVCRPMAIPALLLAALIAAVLKARLGDRLPAAVPLLLLVAIPAGTFLLLPLPHTVYAQAWSKLPHISPNGTAFHIRHIRDYERGNSAKSTVARYLEEDFELQELSSVALIISQESAQAKAAQPMLLFVFRDGRNLVFSPEARLPKGGKERNELRTFYREYEMVYLLSTAEDILRLHTNHLRRLVSYHALKTEPATAQAMLVACLRMVQEAQQGGVIYPILGSRYQQSVTDVLRLAAPQLPARFLPSAEMPARLFRCQALLTNPQETWEKYRRRSLVGYDLAKNERADYSDALHKAAGLKPTGLRPERHVQEILPADGARAPRQTETAAAPEQQTQSLFTTPQQAPEPTAAEGKSSPAVLEPGQRLKEERRKQEEEEADEAPRQEIQDDDWSLLEPGARLEAERKAREQAERNEAVRKAAAAKGAKVETDAAGNVTESVDLVAKLLGREDRGIKIIEKPKKKEAPHPLDPYRRRNPLDEETAKEPEADPYSLTDEAKPLHL